MICKSGKDLQNCLDRLEHYTETWNLGVNIDKSKVLVFTKKRTPKLNITISGKVLEEVEEFIYLGVNFNKTGNFAKTSEYMRIKAQKALFSLTMSLIYKPIPISTMLKIFDKTIMPILLYNTFKSQLEIIEGNNDGYHLWLHFVREILKLCKLETVFYNPTNFHTYRIINRVRDALKKRFISFWGTVLTSEETISGKIGRNKLRFIEHSNPISNLRATWTTLATLNTGKWWQNCQPAVTHSCVR